VPSASCRSTLTLTPPPTAHPSAAAAAWVFPPGTYLSRLTLSFVGAGLAAVYTAYYFFQISHGSSTRVEGILLPLALLSCVSMGVVGAVCENPRVASCDVGIFAGVHIFAASLTFGIATAYGLRALRMLPSTRLGRSLKLLVIGSALSKVRWLLRAWPFPPHPRAESTGVAVSPFVLIPMMEWTDALFLIAFFSGYSALTMAGYAVAYVRQALPLQQQPPSQTSLEAPPARYRVSSAEQAATVGLTPLSQTSLEAPPARYRVTSAEQAATVGVAPLSHTSLEAPPARYGVSSAEKPSTSSEKPSAILVTPSTASENPSAISVELAWLAEKPLVLVVRRLVHLTVSTTFLLSWLDGTVRLSLYIYLSIYRSIDRSIDRSISILIYIYLCLSIYTYIYTSF